MRAATAKGTHGTSRRKTGSWAGLVKKIRGIKSATLTTEFDTNTVHSRPLACLKTTEDGVLWFFLRFSFSTAQEISQGAGVRLAYVSGDNRTFVSVTGTATLVEDPKRAKSLWDPALSGWFPEGVEDPDIVLLRVEVVKAEYWNAPLKRMTFLFGVPDPEFELDFQVEPEFHIAYIPGLNPRYQPGPHELLAV
ncbi:MAG: pyridoxamine 5'-phosphate oxidase family protein [Fibrobacteria bacterium]